MKRALSCLRTGAALAAVALAVAGCAAANNATSAQASAQAEQPYRTGYGFSSDGPTTDLYSMIFRPDPPPATTVAAAPPVTAQPVTPVQQGQQYQTAARPGQTVAATPPGRPNQPQTAASRAPQPAYAQPAPPQPAPVQVAQQPAAPAPPPEQASPTAYGISTNGPTTDLYTMIFGPRNSGGQ